MDFFATDAAARQYLEEHPRVWPYVFAFAIGDVSPAAAAKAYGAGLTELDVHRLYNAAREKAKAAVVGTLVKAEPPAVAAA